MDSLDVEILRQQLVEIARGLPIWLKMLRYINLVAALLLAFWVWRSGAIGSVMLNMAVFIGGLIFVTYINIEIWVFAGRLDIIGLLPFLPLVYIAAKTISDRLT